MAQKKRKTKPARRLKNSGKNNKPIVEKEIENIEKEVNKDIREIDGWVYERRKFFIKLAIVAGLIAILLIISHLYLRVNGFG